MEEMRRGPGLLVSRTDFGVDLATHREEWAWRMRGGADADIVARFAELTERAARGDATAGRRRRAAGSRWSSSSTSSRAASGGTRRAPSPRIRRRSRSCSRVSPTATTRRSGTPWEKTFFTMPLGHCEGPDLLERLDRVHRARARDPRRGARAPEAALRIQRAAARPAPPGDRGVRPAPAPQSRARPGSRLRRSCVYLEKGVFPHQREIPRFAERTLTLAGGSAPSRSTGPRSRRRTRRAGSTTSA